MTEEGYSQFIYPQVLWQTWFALSVLTSSAQGSDRHDGVTQFLVERAMVAANRRRHRTYCLESLPCPSTSFFFACNLAWFTTLLNNLTTAWPVRTQLLEDVQHRICMLKDNVVFAKAEPQADLEWCTVGCSWTSHASERKHMVVRNVHLREIINAASSIFCGGHFLAADAAIEFPAR